MHEVINGPIAFGGERGTRDPAHDLSDPWMERRFDALLEELRPEVVHIQELAALPSSLIEVSKRAGVPVLMTLQDYFPLCATLRLYDTSGSVCLRREVGDDCVANNAGAPTDAGPLVAQTLHFELERAKQAIPGLRRINFARAGPVVGAVVSAASRTPEPQEAPAPDEGLGAAYQRRRDVNVRRLRQVDRLVAQSPRVAEIYRLLGVDRGNIQHVPLTLAHLDALTPRSLTSSPRTLTFATINGCAAPSKGANVVLEALRRLSAAGADSRFRLIVLGHVDLSAEPELARHPRVTLRGTFTAPELDGLLDEVDVGVVPSVWEEAFGYVGLEFLGKGIPLVATPVGGIVEYAREGETAWLNSAGTGEGLAKIMLDLIREPERVVDLHRTVIRRRKELIKPMDVHAAEMEELYRELLEAR